MSKIYDVIVLGAGPAGLAAGLYAGRSRLSVLIVEKGQDGGQISITDEIENYPGQIVDQPESGPSLIARMTEQAKKFGAERVSDTIKEVSLEGDVKVLKGEKGEYQAKNIIIATGAHARPIGCKGEAEFLGRGVSYCATCDANFFEDFEVQNSLEKLQSFTDVMSCVQQNPFRRKLSKTTNFTLCGIQLLRKLEEMESFPG